MVKKNKRKNKVKLPKELIHIKNLDKSWHESWDDKEDENGLDILDFPHPFRMLLCGKVNARKTNTIKNIIIRQNPPFENIYLFHKARPALVFSAF